MLQLTTKLMNMFNFFFFGIQYILFLVIKITIPIVRKFNQK